ncbi:MAG TPA: aminotransferase class I/II-fold pyridoxal phosphate-dependent enzyme [Vicinamibacterales bacterium]|nr:aminotransferase class I/II-fold pyridoxal phosphate-dependent enzyme [Vicinamibacterales bacterium]
MAISRRAFLTTAGIGGAVAGGYYLSGGRLLGPWTRDPSQTMAAVANGARLLLHNNENPLGPGARAIEAMQAVLTDTTWPAARYGLPTGELTEALAGMYQCETQNILLGCGSTQILRSATHAFTSPTRPLLLSAASYEECPAMARVMGTTVEYVPITSAMFMDLEALAARAKGAGLVFVCNPNNPTATVLSRTAMDTFVEAVLAASPDTTILLDEAYHEYVTDPDYGTQYDIALKNPRVIVSRTFSKAYGMAGLRLGYAIGMPETLRAMRSVQFGMGANVLALKAAVAALGEPERITAEAARNTAVRQYTMDWFSQHGFEPTDSQCNFIFVNIGRPATEFREGCATHGVMVGRDFPPFEKTHTRVSIGTMEEMQKATAVFADVLGVTQAASAA